MGSNPFGHSPWECTSRNFHRVPGTFKGRTRAYKGRTRATIGRLWGDYGERHTFSPFIEVKQRNAPIYFNKRSTTATVLEKKKNIYKCPVCASRAVFGRKWSRQFSKHTNIRTSPKIPPIDNQPTMALRPGKFAAACTYKKSLNTPR